jgi:hypothetical protein
VLALILAGGALVNPLAAAAQAPGSAWIEKSNANAELLLDFLARFSPESASHLGVPGLDDKVVDLKPRLYERTREAGEKALAELQRRLTVETDAHVRQDLGILIQRVELERDAGELERNRVLPYYDVHRLVFGGLKGLLDDQVAAERRPAALVRLRRYAGLDEGYEPVTKLAADRTRERFGVAGLVGPTKAEVDKNLGVGKTIAAGIGPLFQKYGVAGYEEPLAKLQARLEEYEAFVRSEVLPRARDDYRELPEIYAMNLRRVGVDLPLEELVSRAYVSFREIQNEMAALAPLVAKEKSLTATDYRDVIRALKQQQIVGDAILPHYEKRIAAIEKIITEKQIVTLPKREMRIRLASESESAALPAPHMEPPPLLHNQGEMGTFVLPLSIPSATGEKEMRFDDFTFEAASWTLTAHEGRPGHELQFASLVEKGVSLTRALFAFNSVNVEGWALYAEAEMKPYLPLDGQLVALQHRLMRAARAFLDPGLQLGTVTREEATRVLTEDVVLSPAMALQEVERYTFRAPGQATSYFCGYERLLEIRAEAERVLGKGFDRTRFHDFVLAQGLLPPSLLRQAVREEFYPAARKSSS